MLARVGLAVALAVAGAAALAASRAYALTNAEDDDGDPAVAALLDAAGNTVCTGTLIAPTAVLTAAHCLTGAPPSSVYFGAMPPAGRLIAVAAVVQHPDYDLATGAHDLGIVRIAGGPPIVPAQTYTEAIGPSLVGQPLRLVGFGLASATDGGPARKRSGQSRVDAVSGYGLSVLPSPSQTCFGDSGGPAFALVDGAEQLVGITATGSRDCGSASGDVAAQPFDRAFAAAYLDGAMPAPGVVGGCALAGACDERDARGLALVTLGLLALGRLKRAP